MIAKHLKKHVKRNLKIKLAFKTLHVGKKLAKKHFSSKMPHGRDIKVN